MCEGLSKVFVGIDWGIVDANFVMQMGSSAAAAQADVSNGIATMNILPNGDREVGQVSVAGGDSVAMIQRNRPSVAAQEIREQHHAVGGSDNWLSIRG